MAKKDAVDIIDAKIEKIASIESKRKLQNINLKDDVSSTTKSSIEEIKSDNQKWGEKIKENSGFLNSIRRLLGGMKEFCFRPAKQTEAQNNLALSGNSIKSMNNQLVEISMSSRDKNLESDGDFLNRSGYQKQNIVAVENKDNADKISR